MNGLYLTGLLIGIAGVATIDVRFRLFVRAAPVSAVVVLAVGVAGFLLWDTAGIRLGIFFEGNRALITGVQLAPQVPLEELFFLVLLCWTTMAVFTGALRLLPTSATRSGRR